MVENYYPSSLGLIRGSFSGMGNLCTCFMNWGRRLNSLSAVITFIKEEKLQWFEKFFSGLISADISDKTLIVGLTVNTISQLVISLLIARWLKNNKPEKHVVIGGSLLSTFSDDFLKFGPLFEYIDSIIIYEGENAFLDLYRSVKGLGDLNECRNLIWNNKGHVVKNKNICSENINILPPPDFSDFPLSKYLTPEPVLPVSFSRSCYGGCSFCSGQYDNFVGGWRERNVKEIVEDMKFLSKKYNTSYFYFASLNTSSKTLRGISADILKEHLKIRWITPARLEDGFDKKTCELLAKAGCTRIEFGLESFSRRILDLMNKQIQTRVIQEIITNLAASGILIELFIIKNLPTEKAEDFKKTLLFLKAHKRDIVGFACLPFHPMPKTSIWKNPEKYCIELNIEEDEKDLIFNTLISYEYSIPEEEILAKENMFFEFQEEMSDLFVQERNHFYSNLYPAEALFQMFTTIKENSAAPLSSNPERNKNILIKNIESTELFQKALPGKLKHSAGSDIYFLFNTDNLNLFLGNDVSKQILDLCDGRRTEKMIDEMMKKRFDIDDNDQVIMQHLKYLRRKGYIL